MIPFVMKRLFSRFEGELMTCTKESGMSIAHLTTYAGKTVDFVTIPPQASVVFPVRGGLLFTARRLCSN
jgi:hypothetical protein